MQHKKKLSAETKQLLFDKKFDISQKAGDLMDEIDEVIKYR